MQSWELIFAEVISFEDRNETGIAIRPKRRHRRRPRCRRRRLHRRHRRHRRHLAPKHCSNFVR